MIGYKLESLSIEYDHACKMLQDDLQANTEPISRVAQADRVTLRGYREDLKGQR